MTTRERPIIFSEPMVRAVLAKRKTMTRRIVKPQPQHPRFRGMLALDDEGIELYLHDRTLVRAVRCPYGKPGDRLWVRETWGVGSRPDPWGGYEGIEYRADQDGLEDDELLPCHHVKTPDDICLSDYRSGWHPSIHMPRWASRITLEVTAVRIERLQDISEADAFAEGVQCESYIDYRRATTEDGHPLHSHAVDLFHLLWEALHGPGSWDANPMVWVVGFKRIAA